MSAAANIIIRTLSQSDEGKDKPPHTKCRNTQYLGDKIDAIQTRGSVPDNKISFDVEFEDYKAVEFTSKVVLGPDGKKPVWADPSETNVIKFNALDGKIDRRSHEGNYRIENGRPFNIRGRTGIKGRGLLGKWGPNHAADPVVTRWKRNINGEKLKGSEGKYILQFVAIQRLDTGEWAIPGGMCDPGESISLTLKREFMEEAANSTEKNEHSKALIEKKLDAIFSRGELIYKGYVDDPRNTDNAWMETQCYNFHDEDGSLLKDFKLEAGDDAQKAKWMDIDSNLKLYASHLDFIKNIVNVRDSNWLEKSFIHDKCRNSVCAGNQKENIQRAYVADQQVQWDSKFEDYNPKEFTSVIVTGGSGKKPAWADPEDITGIQFNKIDNGVDRRSHSGLYKLEKNGRPINTVGRTGITGRGILGKWGPNHAADPIVTRWKRNILGKKEISMSGKPILQFVAIQRTDTKEWAIPGGMCDPGESISLTLKREFMEEAANSTEKNEKSKAIIDKKLEAIFSKGKLIYKGYVDDPRNTDNAWMETQCYNFHDWDGTLLKDFKLEAGDDARKVKWMDVDANLQLYASHRDFIEKVVADHDAHWKEPKFHHKCRSTLFFDNNRRYYGSYVHPSRVSWDVPIYRYNPVEITSEAILGPDGKRPVWADPPQVKGSGIKFNQIDGKTDRRSHEAVYQFDSVTERPLNVVGRTGFIGRKLLGKWGPNHAADPIVTRWKTDDNGRRVLGWSGKPVLQFDQLTVNLFFNFCSY